ncbi:MAG: short-chain dehydrogenase [Gammaproteobacteria bacterium]|nr:short-chain dehydrogenase [Gammaproteobacteria bacterium]OUU07844.1 MAG: short-chain dehydrogenase [Gammaproteobacteria bacterium TMED34]
MQDFSGKIAVVTGGGTGMGRALVRQLMSEGCDVATCDVIEENLAETRAICEAEAPQGVRIYTGLCDVALEDQVHQFADDVAKAFDTDHIHLLFNNAGIGGGGSFIDGDRGDWERTFNICWLGVYNFCRAFTPMLKNAPEGQVVNTSSVNGFWASLGGGIAHTAYSAAKFAVKGFSEALITDFKLNAPHLSVSVVMPGHVGTDIGINSRKILGGSDPEDMTNEEIERFRENIVQRMGGVELTDDQIREAVRNQGQAFKKGGITPEEAANIIITGVKNDEWRILVGEDAKALDRAVRSEPLKAYDEDFFMLLAQTRQSGD